MQSRVQREFTLIGSVLLNRGIALVQNANTVMYSGDSRYARLALILPEAHRPFLPRFPIATEPLGPGSTRTDASAIIRKALARCEEVIQR